MLDDYSQMEKKPSGRSVLALSKPGGTENNKNLDAINKPFGKYTKRRELNTYNNPKNEPPRKNYSTKAGKYADKRPKPRNQYYNCGKEDSKVANDEGPEFGSVFIPGSKKQNLNHLLNFHYAPRVVSRSSLHWTASTPQNWFTTQKHKYNKELFLQANCQFIVKENADYTPHFFDPDLLVDWDHIEQIRLQSGALVFCPICLDIPTAGKITRCGHVFCWSCILHYLALSDKTWRKCPICFEAVHKNDLKSVITLAYTTYNVNEEITFKLMRRERGSLLPLPVEDSHYKDVSGPLSLSETDSNTIYSKLLLAKPDDVLSIIQIEKLELNSQLTENEGCPEICFIEQALNLLNEREEAVKMSLREAVNASVVQDIDNDLAGAFNAGVLLHENQISQKVEHRKINNEIDTEYEEDQQNIDADDLEISNNAITKPFYFYQAADGQHIYLHSINVKMLEMQFGSLEKCPFQITGKIIEKEGGSMTEGLRKRLRYLQHLPLTCQFEVAEINVAAYVSDEVLFNFKGQIEARMKRRNRRAREERRREKKINEEVNMLWGRKPSPELKIESHHDFPLCGSVSDEVFPVFSPSPPESNGVSRSQSLNSLSSASATLDSIFEAASSNQPTSSSWEYTGRSFAQMLKEGTSRNLPHESWRDLKNERNPGSKSIAADSDNDLEGYAPVPNFSQSFGDAIALALEKANHNQADMANKKKKKKKQKVLFTTGMACSAK